MSTLRSTIVLAALVCAPAVARPSPGLPPIQTWKLDNGLTVAHMALSKAPVVTVQLWYHVGSKEEARNRRGSAHMFEHMMFKGTAHVRPENHARLLNQVGGYVNAFTTEDVTAYHNTLPKQYLDFAVRLEAERMQNLLFRPKMIDTEREVVKEEIRTQENNPVTVGFLRLLEVAYKTHPYAWTAGGSIDDLGATTAGDLESFYKTYYVPNNAMLVVVGDVDAKQVKESAERWFGALKAGPKPPRPADAAPEPVQKAARREVVQPGQIGLVVSGYHIPEATHADIPALQVLALILSGGESSRLHRRLVRKDKTAVQAGGQLLIREHPGLFLTLAAYLDPKYRGRIETALGEEIGKVRTRVPSARELTKAKNQLSSAYVFGLQTATGIAQQIGTSWVQSGDPRGFRKDLERFQAVTAADVKRVAQSYLTENNKTTVVIPLPGASK